jgi:molybdopterin converting factor subunit 1
MMVHVQLFARARDLALVSVAVVDVPAGATVRELKKRLQSQYPMLEALLARSTIAVNDEYAKDDQVLPADATLALIPPVSGG